MAERHRGLIVLSHDHHHGLALALRLRQGNDALLNDGWTHDRREQARRVIHFYRHDLMPHFTTEEEALFPGMKRCLPEAAELIGLLAGQHREMSAIIERLDALDEQELDRALVTLGEIHEKHIRLEERTLFPMFENEVPLEQSDTIVADIVRTHTKARKRQDEAMRRES